VVEAILEVTAAGVYEAELNGQRVGEFILAPGWTEYHKRLQVQRYDVTAMLGGKNRLDITVANGWYRRANAEWTHTKYPDEDLPAMAIALLQITCADGEVISYPTSAT
jgi:alpha-L-rhamnosidase